MLASASAQRNSTIFKQLVDVGVDALSTDHDQISPLHIAAVKKDIRMLKRFIQNGVDLNATDASQSTPLHYACTCGRIDLVQLLISWSRFNHTMLIHLFTISALLLSAYLYPVLLAFTAKSVSAGQAHTIAVRPVFMANTAIVFLVLAQFF